MSAAAKRIFRIERQLLETTLPGTRSTVPSAGIPAPAPACAPEDDGAARHRELLQAIQDLKTLVAQPSNQPAATNEPVSSQAENSPPAGEQADKPDGDTETDDLAEARKLKSELNLIHEAIARTKQEIVSLQHAGHQGDDMSRVADELGAIIDGTEQATESILTSAETIDQSAGDLAAMLSDESQQNLACDIQDNVVRIFEACNFQDLTGQRINKVVKAFSFIESRVVRMLEIWGGIEGFKGIDPETATPQRAHEELLNGPALDDDEDIASQADIDALFD